MSLSDVDVTDMHEKSNSVAFQANLIPTYIQLQCNNLPHEKCNNLPHIKSACEYSGKKW